MITDDLLLYLLFHLILFAFTLIGIKRMPMMLLFVILADAILAVPTIIAFADYVWFGVILVLINCVIPIMATVRAIQD
jgi:hypothetical protein